MQWCWSGCWKQNFWRPAFKISWKLSIMLLREFCPIHSTSDANLQWRVCPSVWRLQQPAPQPLCLSPNTGGVWILWILQGTLSVLGRPAWEYAVTQAMQLNVLPGNEVIGEVRNQSIRNMMWCSKVHVNFMLCQCFHPHMHRLNAQGLNHCLCVGWMVRLLNPIVMLRTSELQWITVDPVQLYLFQVGHQFWVLTSASW